MPAPRPAHLYASLFMKQHLSRQGDDHHLKSGSLIAFQVPTGCGNSGKTPSDLPSHFRLRDATGPRGVCMPSTHGLSERIHHALLTTGSRPAIVFEDDDGIRTSLSGNELLRHSRAIAHRLRAAGDDGPVALPAHRNADTVAGMVACLDTGRPWLPLDPSLAPDLWARRIAPAGVRTLLSSGKDFSRTSELAARISPAPTVVRGDRYTEIPLPDDGVHVAPSPGGAGRTAYLIQTSGTTGEPKTIAVPLSSLDHYLTSTLPLLGGPALRGERLGVLTTLAADLGYTVLFSALLASAELHLVPEHVSRDPGEFAAYQGEHRLDLYKTTPGHLRALLAQENGARCLPGSLLIAGGEAFTEDLLTSLSSAGAQCRVLNHYGPAETCIGVALGEVFPAPVTIVGGTAPVGRAIGAAELTVLDPAGNRVAPGIEGEVAVGGPPVGWGYLGAPAQTADRFRPDRRAAGGRHYLTGDVGVIRENGDLHVLGRVDRQRKVRGRRVEPAGVEAVLRETGLVTDAHVDVRHVGSLGAVVVAWVSGGPRAEPGAIRARAALRLPDHALPSRIILLPRLPRTANGKIDSAALPGPDTLGAAVGVRTRSAGGAESGGDTDPLEREVTAAFAAVLGLPALGLDDDVLALGAHSLAIVQVTGRLGGAGLGVSDVYTARTSRRVARLLAERGARPVDAEHGTPTSARPSGPPPTGFLPQQQGIWIDEARHRGHLVYRIPLRWEMRGPLRADDVGAAFDRVLARHGALRSRAVLTGEKPVVVRDAVSTARLSTADVSALAPSLQDAEATRLGDALFAEPVDPERGPAIAALLVRRAADHHDLFALVHHGVFDAASADVLIDELLGGGGLASPPAEPVPLTPAPHTRHGRRALPAPAEFALDGGEPGAGPGDSDVVLADLPAPLWERVRAAADAAGVSLYTVVLSAWATVLGRQNAERHFAVATAVDVRADHGLGGRQPVIGCFVNTVPVVVDMDPGRTTAATWQSVAGAVAAALDDRLRPYSDHASWMRGTYGTGVPARASCTLQQTRAHRHADVSAFPRPTTVARATADLDLVVTAYEDHAPVAALHFRPGVCDRMRARRLADQFLTVLGESCAHPELPISRASSVSAAAREEVLALGRGPDADARPGLVSPVRRVALLDPGADAVRTPDGNWSRERLLGAADSLRAALRNSGAGPGDRVGLVLPPSPELVATWLAVLDLGAVVVPCDPGWPAQRLRQAFTATGPSVVVCAGPLPDPGAPVLDVQEALRTPPAGPPGEEPSSGTAYIVLTSGSTGVPGAVAVPREAARTFLGAMDQDFPLTGRDRVLVLTSPGFDVSVWETLGPLGSGAALVVPPYTSRTDVEGLRRLITDEQVTVFQTVPSLLQALLDAPGAVGDTALRLIVCGGEEMPPRLAERVRAELPGVTLVNAYGPTETTVDATRHPVTTKDGRSLRVPIGGPVGGGTVYVLDAEGALAAPGAVGELAIGGAGVAHGYLGAAGRTAARFLPDPFRGVRGARMFLTGDRVRWTVEGRLDFLGRMDNQVQVRGQRVELEEIEAVLLGHADIVAAVALLDTASGSGAQLTARVVLRRGPEVTAESLRRHLAERLPATAVPERLLRVDALPRLPNGKLDRAAAGRLPGVPLAVAATVLGPVEERVAGVWETVLAGTLPGADTGFFDAGGNSLLVMTLRARLSEEFGVELRVADLFAYPTIRQQAARLAPVASGGGPRTGRPVPSGTGAREHEQAPSPEAGRAGFPVAVVSLACRAPGASDASAFWSNLRDGVVSTRHFDRAELLAAGVPAAHLDDPRHVPVCAPLDEPYHFDAGFFRMSDEEATLVSPQHRLFLDCAWQALEAAGCLAKDGPRRIGVFAGSSEESHRSTDPADLRDTAERIALELGSSQDFLATRVAHLLDLRGPAMSVRTACSTSLVAVHLAVRAIAAGECDVALAGGVALRRPTVRGHFHEPGGIYSADGRCRPYDAASDGIVSGDGVGAVVLKPLDRALADGDHVHAVIRGTAVNNDGADKSGFTAPSFSGQVDVVRSALAKAGVDASTIGYVEGHGTGTALGDPIEVAALSAVWRRSTEAVGVCSLGSVKGNIGHLDAAAGVMGLIKACLAVEHGEIPGLPTWEKPNPELNIEDCPFVLHSGTRSWPTTGGPRRASVHALGLGGTNAHVVIEQAPPRTAAPDAPLLVLPLSAPTAEGVGELAASYARALPDGADASATARTARSARTSFPVRRAVVAAGPRELRAELGRDRAPVTAGRPPVVLMFPGGGSIRPGAGRRLYETVPAFRDALGALCDPVEAIHGLDLRELLWGRHSDRLATPRFGFVAHTALGIAVSEVLRAFVDEPLTLLGYSLGELSAAAAADVFGPAETLRIAELRGRVFERVPDSGSSYVACGAARVATLLRDDLVVAVLNGPGECVVSGSVAALAGLERRLTALGIDHRRIAVPGAVHSPLLDPFLDEYRALVASFEPRPARLPLVSNVTGKRLTEAEATDPGYWARQLRSTVLFDDCLETAARNGAALVDAGPGQGLRSLAQGLAGRRPGVSAHAVMGGGRAQVDEALSLARCLGDLWERGASVDWERWPGSAGHRSPAPVAPLARRALPPPVVRPSERQDPTGAGGVRLWRRLWRQVPLPRADAPARLVLLADDGELRDRYLAGAQASGTPVRVTAVPEEAWTLSVADDAWVVDLRPLHGAGIEALLPLVAIAPTRSARLCVVFEGGASVLGDEPLDPAAAMLWPAVLAAAQERSGLRVAGVDVTGAPSATRLLGALLAGDAPPPETAVRGASVWEATVAPVEEHSGVPGSDSPVPGVPATGSGTPAPDEVLRRGGVYVVTGGLGRYGRWVAEQLLRRAAATVVLLQRGAPGPVGPASGGEAGRRSAGLARLRRLGGRVETMTCDVADAVALGAVLDRVEESFGPVAGVVHAAGDISSAAGFSPLGDLMADGLEAGIALQGSAKVHGTRALEQVLAGRSLDFCVLMSSNAALLAGPGLSLYAPVNAYQHGAAQRGERPGRTPWISIGWDGWRLPTDAEGPLPGGSLDRYALSGEEAFDALCRSVRAGLPSVYVSRGSLADRYRRWVSDHGTDGSSSDPEAADTAPVPAAAPGDVLGALRQVWTQLAGGPEPAPDEDLFGLGGTSLTLMRLRARVRDLTGVDVPLAALMDRPTLARTAALVAAGGAVGTDGGTVGTDGPVEPEGDPDLFSVLDDLEATGPRHDDPKRSAP
ncbi:amino acid adenylation domain-containing protein [Streptomyces anulatus]|uniref:amino acid adenylation domain-containing protein n=1 Tax=Streptomyces anulatus TaxID=1892 RepID=UPI0038692ADC